MVRWDGVNLSLPASDWPEVEFWDPTCQGTVKCRPECVIISNYLIDLVGVFRGELFFLATYSTRKLLPAKL